MLKPVERNLVQSHVTKLSPVTPRILCDVSSENTKCAVIVFGADNKNINHDNSINNHTRSLERPLHLKRRLTIVDETLL